MLIFDNFLPTFGSLRRYADTAAFGDIRSPIDGIVYPDICLKLPRRVEKDVASRLQRVHQNDVTLNLLFMRLSVAGVPVPNETHTDNAHGSWSLMLYLTPDEFVVEGAGTSFLEHRELGLTAINADQRCVEIARHDANRPEAWEQYDLAPMKENRGVIFDSHLFHRAEPVGGFGTDQKNGRLVLTAFYNVNP